MHNHDKLITTADFNKFIEVNFEGRLNTSKFFNYI